MRTSIKAILFTAALSVASFSFAEERATADEAFAMVKKMAAYIKANGKEKAIDEVNTRKGQFIDRDLYVNILDMSGNLLADGNNGKIVGKNTMEMKDVDGKAFIKEGMEMLKTKSNGRVAFKWPNPMTKHVENKVVYFEKVGDVVISVGSYQ